MTDHTNNPDFQTIHQRFEFQVERHPDKLAIIDNHRTITYRELNQRSNQLAHFLQTLGIQLEQPIGIIADRSIETIMAILAILKVGGTYIALDPNYPQNRLNWLWQDAQLNLLLTQTSLNNSTVATFPGRLIPLDQDYSHHSDQNLPQITSSQHLSHIIYTSGSTGQPKGVLLEHGNVLNLMTACQTVFGFTEQDIWALFHSFAFDVSVWELWGALLHGGTVVMISHLLSRSPADLYQCLCEQRVTVLNQTPLAFYQLAQVQQHAHQQLSLRYIMIGGEVLDFSRLAPWFARLGDQHPQIINLYGLTETTVNVSFYRLTQADCQRSQCLIGQAIPTVQIHLLDADQQPVPIGTIGEIYVGGKGIARGYLNRPDLTAQRFIFHSNERLYRTGDLGRFSNNGILEYLGRSDQQVQIHGFRVEPGEIETVLRQHELVDATVVIAREDQQVGERQLVAYVVFKQNTLSQVKDQVADWQKLYEYKYGELTVPTTPPLHNFLGWHSSYTGLPIPNDEMQNWVAHTLERLQALKPQRVLEIGCGTGLLLWRLAPQCSEYIGTDFSQAVIEYLRYWQTQLSGFEHVQLLHQEANQFSSLGTQQFDTIIINSVVQYFPSLDYLQQVITNALSHLVPGGHLFLGDIRNYLLLNDFHTTVLLAQASTPLTPEQLAWQRTQNVERETELLIDPTYFGTLPTQYPQINQVKVWPKRGQDRNELTCFRYDVITQTHNLISSSNEEKNEAITPVIYDWESLDFNIMQLPQRLTECSQAIKICRVPNQRLKTSGLDPELFWEWSTNLPYQVEVSWLNTDLEGSYEVIFTPNSQTTLAAQLRTTGLTSLNAHSPDSLSPRFPTDKRYANTPWQAKLERHLIPQLRKFLQDRLPDYLVPTAIVKLDRLPLTVNGKVDKRALPAPPKTRAILDCDYLAPQTVVQQHLAHIWQTVLGIEEPIGIQDNFFELGGDSLKVIQVINRAKDFQLNLSFEQFFKYPTIAELVIHLSPFESPLEIGPDLSQTTTDQSAIQTYPLSPLQAGMLYHILREETSTGMYLIQFLLDLQGAVNPHHFSQACQAICNRHPALRSSFHWQGRQQPVQVVHPEVEIQVSQQDWRSRSASQQRLELEKLVEADRIQGFDLTQVPLLRFTLIQTTDQHSQLLLTYVHLIVSEWEQLVLLEELFKYYEALQAGQSLQLPPTRPYRDFISYLHSLDRQAQEQFWRHTLRNYQPTRFPLIRREKLPIAYREQQWSLPNQLTQQLTNLARQHKITLNTLLTGTYALLLSKYLRTDDVAFGLVFSGRNVTWSGFEHTVGLFINTVPLRVPISPNESLGTWLTALQAQVVELSRYEHSSLVDIQGWSEVPRGQDLFETILVFDEERLDDYLNKHLSSLHINGFQILYESTNYPLTFAVMKGTPMMVRAIFNEAQFAPTTVERLLEHYQTLLENLVMGLLENQAIHQLSLVSQTQRHQVVNTWNQTATDYPKQRCIHDLFEQQVEHSPRAVALVFKDQRLSYAELNARANQLAHFLRQQGINLGQPIGLCLERSLESIIGLLGILKAGGIYVPLDPSYPKERLAFMLKDTQLSIILTQQSILPNLPTTAAQPWCLDTQWHLIAQSSSLNIPNKTTANSLAYIMYTSGTTGLPKGVCITHQAVVRLVKDTNYIQLTAKDIFLQFAPMSFDASTFEIWGCLLNGGRLVIMPPHLPSLEELGTVLKQYHITVLWLTAGLFHQMVEERLSDLAGLKYLLAGGDVLGIKAVQRILQHFPTITLINGYGPTENTTFTCCYPMSGKTLLDHSVPIGYPIANTQVYVVDHHQQPLPTGVPGELLIGGDGLATGYLNHPQLTAEKFIPHPFSQNSQDRLYKTGDWVYYLPDGCLEFLGRLDQQVKIRGFRIEPQEIEVVLAQHSQVSEAIVAPWTDSAGQKQLVAYVIPKPNFDLLANELRDFLKPRLPDYMIPSFFQILTSLPLTPNGKVDRRALPKPIPTASRVYIAPRSPEEELLIGIWSEVLGINQPGVQDNFFELGGHSLLATQVVSRIRAVFQVELPLRYLFEFPTVEELVKRLLELQKVHLPTLPLQPVSRAEPLPLSFAQQRLWFIENFAPGNTAYIVVNGLILRGNLQISALEFSLQTILQRQDSLRTVFPMIQGRPVQQILPMVNSPLTVVDLSDLPADSQTTVLSQHIALNNQTTFNLNTGPLTRFKLIRLALQHHLLLLALHHIISDGWSLGVFYRELSTCYQAALSKTPVNLPQLPIQYVDFAVGQRAWLTGEIYDRQMNYWKSQLANLPVFQFPTDYSRPPIQTFSGATVPFQLSESMTVELENLSQTQGVTLFMTLLAAFLGLLFRYTGQTDIAVGSPIANRNRHEIEHLIGFFVNTLVLRANLSERLHFDELLQQVRQTTLQGYAHQDLPFEHLVEELHPERNTSVNPLIQVIFALQNSPLALPNLSDLTVELFDHPISATRFDLEFHLWRQPRVGLTGFLIYNTDLFALPSLQRLLGYFERFLQSVLLNPKQALADIAWLTVEERFELLHDLNQTVLPYPREQAVHTVFESQVAQTPDAIALLWKDSHLTYLALNQRANQLAHYLQSLGIKPETPVGIYLSRSLEMIIGILGILKAGGCYVPLDPANPAERVRFILEDTQTQWVLIQRDCIPGAPNGVIPICLEQHWPMIAQYSVENCSVEVNADSLCYVTYTSGSTGKAKGVSVVHRGVVRLVKNSNYVTFDKTDVLLQLAPLAFDASTFEIWGALLNGARLVIAHPEKPTLAELGELLRQYQVSVLWLTASLFQMMVAEQLEDLASVQQLLAGGDVLPPSSVRRIWQRFPQCTVINGYGPTENTTFTCCYRMQSSTLWGESVPIGKPISNTQVYILDAQMALVPRGMVGELYAGGDGLARGYWHRPDLTTERFLPNPFQDETGSAILYRTGDWVRWREEGVLEFIGRLDDQVKIRGFRIELAEIDKVLSGYPAIKQSLTLAKQAKSGDKRLVAYVIPDFGVAEVAAETQSDAQELVAEWETVFDQNIYARSPSDQEVKVAEPVNFVGWNSSYTGEPIPLAEMQVWSSYRLQQLQALQAQRVLEIGCGMGILLLPLAIQSTRYVGTDISQVALEYVAKRARNLPQVQLLKNPAERFEILADQQFDLCILNSTVQYFPGVDYLLTVLEGALQTVALGGCIFVGDVRNFRLLKMFQASVQLHKAEALCSREELRQRVQWRLLQENELLLDPSFFTLLPQRFPRITQVHIQLQRGWAHNELTQFRYDVFLWLDRVPEVTQPPAVVIDWMQQAMDLSALQAYLEREHPDSLWLTGLPNARLSQAVATVAWLESEMGPSTVGEWKANLSNPLLGNEQGVEPEEIWTLGEKLGYQVELSYSPNTETQMGNCQALFWRSHRPTLVLSSKSNLGTISWNMYANQPLQGDFNRKIAPKLRDYLAQRLPDYMIPAAFVVLSQWPLNANGKIDRRALPEPRELQTVAKQVVSPQTELEQQILAIWQEVLQVTTAGVEDNFFDLGGHSLLMVQVCNQVRKTLHRELSVVDMFQHPTVRKMAHYLSAQVSTSALIAETQDRADKQKQALQRRKQLRS